MSIVHANAENFDKEISQGKVIVDFFATWCGPCKMLEPVLEQLTDEISDLKVVKVDVDEQQEIAVKYDVMSMPTMLLIVDGEVKDQKIGFNDKETLKTWIESV